MWFILDTEKDDLDISIRELLLSKIKKQDDNQQTLPDEEKKTRKYHCNNPECKKEITKSEVAYCLHEENKPRFKGKVYCLKCQGGY